MLEMARVNGQSITVDDALRKSITQHDSFLAEVVETLLVREYAAKNGISVSDEELQVAADETRYQRGLEQSEKLHQWMQANHQTALSMQNGLEDMLLRNKSRNAIPESAAQAYFAEHRLEYEQVDLYSLRVDSEEKAKELMAQIREEGPNFYQLAMDHSQDEDTRHVAGYAGRLSRGQMTGEIEAAVFKAKAGEVIGPIKTSNGWNLFKIAAIHPPDYEKVSPLIRGELLKDALTKMKAEAKISYPCLEG